MSPLEILVVAIGLALDAFSVSLAASAAGYAANARAVFRLSFHFGLFQFLMPIAGWCAGAIMAGWLSIVGNWLACFILAGVGCKMAWGAVQKNGKTTLLSDPSKGWAMVLLSVATSIDALVVGFGLGLITVNIFYVSLLIGLVTAILSLFGIYLGSRVRSRFGKKVEMIGGFILVGIALKILMKSLL